MKRRLLSAIITISVLLAGFAAYSVAKPKNEFYTVTADVTQAPNLFAGARVMVRGVDVGKIADVEPFPDHVTLTLEIDEDVPVPADATLAIVPITVIADRYIQLFPPYTDGERLEDGDHISLDRTSIPAELDDVLTQLQGLLSALEPREGEDEGPLRRLIRGLDQATRGNSDVLAGTLEGSADVLSNLADSDEDITGLIRNLDRLFFALANRSSEIGIINERFALVAESLLGDQEHLEGTIENLAFLADETANLFSESGESLGQSFGRLSTVLRTVLKHQDELSEGIRWANVISEGLGATDSAGKGLYAYSGRQAAPGTPASTYNYRIDGRDTLACERIEVTANVLLAILPGATVDDVMGSLLSYLPDEYDDDLAFLLRQLVPLCTSLQELPSATPRMTAEIEKIVAQVGEERFKEMLARWLAESLGVTR